MKSNRLLNIYITLVLTAGVLVSAYACATYGLQLRLDVPFWLLLIVSVSLCLNAIIIGKDSSMMLFLSILVFAMTNQPILNIYCIILVSFLTTKVLSMALRLELASAEWLDVKLFFNIALLSMLTGLSYGWVQALPQAITLTSVLTLAGLCAALCIINFLLTGLAISLSSNRNAFQSMLGTLIKNTMLETFCAVIWYMMYKAYGSLGFVMFTAFIALVGGAVGNGISALQLNQRLIIDSLTGAYNRSYFSETIQVNLASGKPFTLLFLDIDDFKRINDTHGHLAGDAALIAFTREIKRHLRKEDMLFRYAGDEFCIVFPNRPQAESFGSRLRGLNPIECSLGDRTIDCHFSFGYIDHDGRQQLTFEELLDAVDHKMYKDKNTRKANRALKMTPSQS